MSLTRRQREILRDLRDHVDDDPADADFRGELVLERGVAYLGLDRVAARTVFALLRLCALRAEQDGIGGVERFTINETGRDLLEREAAAEKDLLEKLRRARRS